MTRLTSNIIQMNGGPGSGDWGHAGRPGRVGGSAGKSGGGGSAKASGKDSEKVRSAKTHVKEDGRHLVRSASYMDESYNEFRAKAGDLIDKRYEAMGDDAVAELRGKCYMLDLAAETLQGEVRKLDDMVKEVATADKAVAKGTMEKMSKVVSKDIKDSVDMVMYQARQIASGLQMGDNYYYKSFKAEAEITYQAIEDMKETLKTYSADLEAEK